MSNLKESRIKMMDEPIFEPLLAAAEALGAPLYIHPTIPPNSVVDTYYNIEDSYAKNVLITGGWGWHIETGTHVLRLIASGVFDRHPNLIILIGHLGEGLPFFQDRLSLATGGKLKKSYPEYLKENVYYTMAGFNYLDLLEYVIKKVGSNHILFSSDYPMAPAETAVNFINNVEIDEKVKEQIAHRNAEKLFKLNRY